LQDQGGALASALFVWGGRETETPASPRDWLAGRRTQIDVSILSAVMATLVAAMTLKLTDRKPGFVALAEPVPD
jgi:hypothetical protein